MNSSTLGIMHELLILILSQLNTLKWNVFDILNVINWISAGLLHFKPMKKYAILFSSLYLQFGV
jgi:hypothetical protein